MSIPYRTRRILRQLLTVLLVLMLLTVLVALCWVLWLGRYVVYTRDGAKLDLNRPVQFIGGQTAPREDAGAQGPTVSIRYDDGSDDPVANTELVRFSGYYVDLSSLTKNFSTVSQQLLSLPAGTTVMLQLKDRQSNFYYSTALGSSPESWDPTQADQLIRKLKDKGIYVIAQVPAFQEKEYILENERERVPYGLPEKGGSGHLWRDRELDCYWLNPSSEGAVTHLIDIIKELRDLGVDEVLLKDFRFPETSKIAYSGDKNRVLTELAQMLVDTFATKTFALSFGRPDTKVALPVGRTRLYLEGISAADAAQTAADSGIEPARIHLVFLTDSTDTRFDEFCVLRPIDTLH